MTKFLLVIASLTALGVTTIKAPLTIQNVGAPTRASQFTGAWRFRMSSSGYKGITGSIAFNANGSYDLTVSRGELWRITSTGQFRELPRPAQDNSEGILRLTPTKWDIPAEIPFDDMRTLSDNNIPLRSPAEYRLFHMDEGGSIKVRLCHTEREPRTYSFSQCTSPWQIEQ